jgi:tripartite ATP-independent transporter DctM subunit
VIKTLAVRAENLLASLAIGGITLLPLAEIAWRQIRGEGIQGSGPYASYLLIWVGFLGAAIAARDGKLLTLATGEFIPKGRLGELAHIGAAFVGSAVATVLGLSSFRLLEGDRRAGDLIASTLPVWIADLAMPVGLALIALRLAWRSSPHWLGRGLAATGIAVGWWIVLHPQAFGDMPIWPWIAGVVVGALLGGPVFALLGGIAVFATLGLGDKPITLIIRAQEVLTKSSGLAAIPLFTLAGYLLSEGESSNRLLRLLRALFGWAPGGTAVSAATLCAFFTLFTGGSGVTILVLGGLLLPALVAEGYRERFSVGLLTASGSLGLLFPLSLPLMLYAIVAQAPIEDVFIGGLLPGLLMLGLLALMGAREGIRSNAKRSPFRFGEAGAALWAAKFEVLLPVFVLGMFVTGKATLVESAPLAALYAFIVQRYIHRDIPDTKAVLRVVGDCVSLVGGVLLILAVASGLTDYFVSAEVTTRLAAWTQMHVKSPLVFLLCLNLFLLLVGTVMDIFSAIIVVVPLILPLAVKGFGMDPVHLGIIFVANLELGFLHPPLGLNLLLASVRFKKPVLEVTWATLPMLGILAIGVLLITYWDGLTMGLVHWMHRG